MNKSFRSILLLIFLSLLSSTSLIACGSRIPTIGPIDSMDSTLSQQKLDATPTQLPLPNREIAKVAGEVINSDQFVARAMLTRQKLIEQYLQYEHISRMMEIDPTTNSTIFSLMDQIWLRLDDPASLGESVLDDMVNSILIRQEAQARGITVSASEIDGSIQENFGYFPNGTPTPGMTLTPFSYPTMNATQLALITLTPTSQATTISSSATPPAPEPTGTPYTLQAFQDNFRTAAKDYEKFGYSEADIRQIFEESLYREKLFAEVTADVSHTSEQVWARHILVADESTAITVRGLLEQGGDWVALAQEYSSDPGSAAAGGDLGWFGSGVMVPEFEQAVFDLQVGDLGQPVKSQFGYHIIQVLGREPRPLTAEEYKAQAEQFFSDWLADLRSKSDVTIDDIYLDYIPTAPTLQDALKK